MPLISLSPSLQADLERFAEEHGQSLGDALDQAVAAYLQLHHAHTTEGDDLRDLIEEDTSAEDALAVEEALADLDAEGSMSLEEFEVYMRETYGLSR